MSVATSIHPDLPSIIEHELSNFRQSISPKAWPQVLYDEALTNLQTFFSLSKETAKEDLAVALGEDYTTADLLNLVFTQRLVIAADRLPEFHTFLTDQSV